MELIMSKLKGAAKSRVIWFNLLTIIGTFTTVILANKETLAAVFGDQAVAKMALGATLISTLVNMLLRFVTDTPLEFKYQKPDGTATDESATLPPPPAAQG